MEQEKVVYISNNQTTKKRRKIKYLNIVLLLVAFYFCFTIVKQEIQLQKINKETKTLSAHHQLLQDEEKLLKAKIEDANSDENTIEQARNTLGWVKPGDVKLVNKSKS